LIENSAKITQATSHPGDSMMKPFSESVYAVILAGGSGTRFWPLSRTDSPKQLCHISDPDRTMIEVTLSRLDGLIPPERRLIITHTKQIELTRKIVGNQCHHFIAEPEARNTANALALAALEIEKLAGPDKAPIMISLHADHVIRKIDKFHETLVSAVKLAEENHLVLIGIPPTHGETGFGYLEKGSPCQGHRDAFRVSKFKEKPDQETANSYFTSGRYLWNSGLFTWKTGVILQELRTRLPQSVTALNELISGKNGSFSKVDPALFAATYSKLPKIAIDHAVLEVSDNVVAVGVDLGWQDVGSWDALSACYSVDGKGNINVGAAVVNIDCKNTNVFSDGPLVATLGLENLVVVAAKGAIMVCPKERAQDVKKIVEGLQERHWDSWT
jgi:mannose-1-phosphate guanylyltransferase